MARLNRPELSAWYDVAARWVDAALIRGDSLFTPGQAIWTPANLDELHRRFVDGADVGEGGLFSKLETQLAGASSDVRQLMAELLFGYYLPVNKSPTPANKRAAIDRVLAATQPRVTMPADVAAVLDLGVASGGTGYSVQAYYLLSFYLFAAQRALREDADDRAAIVRDPWRLKSLLAEIKPFASDAARQMLLYMAHPETFEPIMRKKDRAPIAAAFAEGDEGSIDDEDRRLLAIRERMMRERPRGFSFYQPEIKHRWQPAPPLVNPPPVADTDDVRFWKIAPGDQAKDWKLCRDGGFIYMNGDEFGDLATLSYEQFVARLDAQAIAKGTTSNVREGGSFANLVWRFARDLKLDDIVFANRGFGEVLGIGRVVSNYYFERDDRVGPHRRKIDWFDLTPRSVDQPGWRSTLVPVKPDVARAIIGRVSVESKDEDAPEPPAGPRPAGPIAELLFARHNVVLHGPPGTGKTWTSLHLAEAWRAWQGDDSVEQVTFHPSYAYEDFIEGFRPDADGKFSLRRGAFVEFADVALANPTRDFLLIIDELNRGDVARIFGELITLIERDKRDARAARRLPYSRRLFHVPPNLYLLATMNTADRSVSLLDVAIRRRFSFVELAPAGDAFAATGRYLATIEGIDLAALMNEINRRLLAAHVDRDRAIGHAYFLIDRDAASPIATLRDRFRHDVVPLVEEYCYANREQMNDVLGTLVVDGRCDETLGDAAFVAALATLCGGG